MLSKTHLAASTAPAGLPAGIPALGGATPTQPAADVRIAALEQRVAQLEEVVAKLSAVLTVSSSQKATLKAREILLEADFEVKIASGCDVRLQAAGELKLKANGSATLQGANAQVKSTGVTKINGSTISLNDGSKFVARQADPVLGSGAGLIAGGNPSVLA